MRKKRKNIIQGLIERETYGDNSNLPATALQLNKVEEIINEESQKLTAKYNISIEHHNRNCATQFDMNKRTPIHGTTILITANDIVSDDTERRMISAAKNSTYVLGAKTKYENLRDDTDNPSISFTTKGTVLGKKELGEFVSTFYRKTEHANENPSTKSLVIKDAVETAIYEKSAETTLNISINNMRDADLITLPTNNTSTKQVNIARDLKNTTIYVSKRRANGKRTLLIQNENNNYKSLKSENNPSTSKAIQDNRFMDINKILTDLDDSDTEQEKVKPQEQNAPQARNLNFNNLAEACKIHQIENRAARVGFIVQPSTSKQDDLIKQEIGKSNKSQTR